MAITFLACGAVLWWPATVRANSFGAPERAAAASRALVLATQQAISALPPTSAQSFVYTFDFTLGVPVREQRGGPIWLRSTETLAQGSLALRAAGSYFALATTLGPIDYLIREPGTTRYARFGTKLDARAGLLNLTVNYGITDRVEAALNLPLVVVDAEGSEVFSQNPMHPGEIAFRPTRRGLNSAIETGKISIGTRRFSELPGVSFNDGTHAGVGRISVGGKALLYAEGRWRLAASCDFYFPSPSEAEFAGSASASIFPRLIATGRLADWMRLHLDAGYDQDFDVAQLRRFVWDVGLSFPISGVTFDIGVGGSKYARPIQWTPEQVMQQIPRVVLTAVGDNQTGTNYVDVLAGFKVRLSDSLFVSGAVNIPVTDPGVQPIVGGTVAFESYF